MLLYGEKPEYFETTWVKNEWTRYFRKIKNKEKHPKSLIVAYKNFNANQLPRKLKDSQALDANKPQFINILYDHINNILNLSQNVEKLERVEIKSTGSEVIQKRELGSNYVKTSNTTVENILNVVKLLINSGQFEIASSQLQRARDLEPNNSEVKYYGFLIDNKITGTDGLTKQLKSGANQQLLKDIEEIINTSDKQTALSIIETIKSSIEALINVTSKPGKLVNNVHENTVCNLFSLLSSYEYNGRKELNEKIINYSCSNQAFLKLFEQSIKTLDQDQVDEYIDAHIRLVKIIDKYFEFDNEYITSVINISNISKQSLMLYYLDRVKSVDLGNGDVLHQMFVMSQDVKYLEETLKYCSSAKEQLKYLNKFLDTTLNDNNSLYEDILKYIPENEQQLYLKALKQRYEYLKTNHTKTDIVTKVSSKVCPKCKSTNLRNMTGKLYLCNQCQHKFVFNNEVIEQIAASDRISKLKWYVKQLLQIDNNNSEWLYDIFKFDLGLVSDEELIKYSVPLGTLPEFNELLPNLITKYQELVIQILNKQTQLIKQKEEQNKAE